MGTGVKLASMEISQICVFMFLRRGRRWKEAFSRVMTSLLMPQTVSCVVSCVFVWVFVCDWPL